MVGGHRCLSVVALLVDIEQPAAKLIASVQRKRERERGGEREGGESKDRKGSTTTATERERESA